MGYFKQEFRGVFYVKDYDKAISFYRDILELESPYSWDDGPEDRGTKFQVAGGMLEVIRREPERPQGPGTIMIEAWDVDACYEVLSKKAWCPGFPTAGQRTLWYPKISAAGSR